LVVTEAQRRELVRGARAATSTQAYALRCRIVLACAEPGAFNTHVAAQVGVSAMTLRKWRGRFIEYGPAGLADEPRPGIAAVDSAGSGSAGGGDDLGAGPVLCHALVAVVAGRGGRVCRNRRSGRIWRRFDLKPHRSDGFTISTDPLFVEKVVDVVGLYHNPPERAVVLCVDEKSQDPGSGSVAAGAADDAGYARAPHPRLRPARHGTTSLFAAFQHRRRHRDR
jgi:hypothetical protein